MFDVSAEDIRDLSDTDLRELVARLCEAEVAALGFPTSGITWGGSQTAADGGLDVRVALPPGSSIDGFVPRAATGFQVKKPDMQPAAIRREMRPAGATRPVIKDLADSAGAYVIVSSAASTSDSMLQARTNAMRAAVGDLAIPAQLHVDFYDQTRMATWVRRHAGLIAWVKEKVGRSFSGWRPYGAWAGGGEGVDAEYLLDEKLKVHLGTGGAPPSLSEAIDELRRELAQPGKVVRLVGLSGVGKTRFVQALFDRRIGSQPLAPALAVYTNLADNPDPQPIGLASDLLAGRGRAVLIVDNCPPDLHRRLSELCTAPTSTVSVITIEYDVRDDQPEGTQVVKLDTSSPELIGTLIRRRYAQLSDVDVRTIAVVSGGNARIAIALAGSVERFGTLAGLSNEELFQRLFRQRHDTDHSLLRAAQVCSLLYSFDGENIDGPESELQRIGVLAGQVATELHGNVAELVRRDLVQHRANWRAVLPHAIANRLAARALADIPYRLIEQHFIQGTQRLARSFARRLSYLHDSHHAVRIVTAWLAPDGYLGDVSRHDANAQRIFESVAPVAPEAALTALERGEREWLSSAGPFQSRRYFALLRSLAYDAELFDRCSRLLTTAATELRRDDAKSAGDIFSSMFTIVLSGTHASVDQRLAVVERLLRASSDATNRLGLDALEKMLQVYHFSSHHRFEFGARSRDFGYRPTSDDEQRRWFGSVLSSIEKLYAASVLRSELRGLVARAFRGLWTRACTIDQVEQLARALTADGFWREGWIACRQTISVDASGLSPDSHDRLIALESRLRPRTLADRVRGVVLGGRSRGLDLDDVLVPSEDGTSGYERQKSAARDLGAEVAGDADLLVELGPELLLGGHAVVSFGQALATASRSPDRAWAALVGSLPKVPGERQHSGVLCGFVSALWQQDKEAAERLLDSAVEGASRIFLPALHPELNARGAGRLKQLLGAPDVPIEAFRALAWGRTTDQTDGKVLGELMLLIAVEPGGFSVALEILGMRLYTDRAATRAHDPELLAAGRKMLGQATFGKGSPFHDFQLTEVVRSCSAGAEGSTVAAKLATQLRAAVLAGQTYGLENEDLLKTLFEVHPGPVLDALFSDTDEEGRGGLELFDFVGDRDVNPADVIGVEALVAWCEAAPARRYAVAASFISFARRPDEAAPLVWSDHAKALMARAPDLATVLTVLIDRFRPTSWSGSRAALIEANAGLLDASELNAQSDLSTFLAGAKARLAQEIAQERASEAREDRVRDERFED